MDLIKKKEDLDIIVKIAERADKKGILVFDRLSLMMDLGCANEEFHLRLEDLLNASDGDFVHDVCGIMNNLNRETKKMGNFFTPRFCELTKEL